MTRTEYKNAHAKEHYDRINLSVPKGIKAEITKSALECGLSVNEYLLLLFKHDTKTGSSALKDKLQGFTDEQRAMLDSWQVGRKYQDMIESFSFTKGEGYFIRLKKGFINEKTGSRDILCETMKEMRLTVNKSRPVNK